MIVLNQKLVMIKAVILSIDTYKQDIHDNKQNRHFQNSPHISIQLVA